MKGGILNRLVITPLIGLTLFFTGCYFVLGGPSTAAFGKVTTTALGYGAGVTLGSLPNLFQSMKSGQAAVGGSSSSSGSSASKAPAQKAAPKAAAPNTGNRSNDGTD